MCPRKGQEPSQTLSGSMTNLSKEKFIDASPEDIPTEDLDEPAGARAIAFVSALIEQEEWSPSQFTKRVEELTQEHHAVHSHVRVYVCLCVGMRKRLPWGMFRSGSTHTRTRRGRCV